MEYVLIEWHQRDPGEPIVFASELDAQRYEHRKIELYPDGRLDWAGQHRSTGTTWCGELPMPTLSEIAALDEFAPRAITATEFELMWQRARAAEETA